MEKKVIDLQCEEGEVKLLLPKNWRWNTEKENCFDTMILELPKKDPFNLVPKSWEQFCNENNLDGEYFITKLSNIIKIDDSDGLGRDVTTDCMYFSTYEEAEAFKALIKLRRLWHEWTKILGIPCQKENFSNYIICYDEFDKEWNTLGTDRIIGGALIFKEQSHAEKFIKYFKELLEKAKILL